jgi:TM2 domain-containing membrane protein YozV
MNLRSAVSMVLAFLVPGAGHLYLGRRARGATYLAIVVFMFLVGLFVDGGLYTLAESQGALLRILASIGSMGSGLMYFIAKAFGPYGNVTSMTFEYGTTFTLTAGLMNLLLVVDCYDIAMGRKQ